MDAEIIRFIGIGAAGGVAAYAITYFVARRFVATRWAALLAMSGVVVGTVYLAEPSFLLFTVPLAALIFLTHIGQEPKAGGDD